MNTPYTFKPHILALKGVFLYANACLLAHPGNHALIILLILKLLLSI